MSYGSPPPIAPDGAPAKRKFPVWLGVGIGAFAFCCVCSPLIAVIGGAGVGVAGSSTEIASRDVEAQKARQDADKSGGAAEEEIKVDRWVYSAQEESMGRGITRFAEVKSVNVLNFDFPYQGEQHGMLTLRKDPKHGNEIIVSIEQGQILLDSMGGTSIPVRFDDRQIMNFKANPPADLSTEMIFLEGYDRFVRELRKSKRVRIEFTAFNEGSHTLDFDVTGFSAQDLDEAKP